MNFDLFDTALKNFEKFEKSKEFKRNILETVDCSHSQVECRAGVETCTSCGEVLKQHIMHDREWRNYMNSGKKDPTRVQMRKTEERSIFKDVQGLGFSNKIVSIANELYTDVSKGRIFRGNCRKAIIFACIFHSYKSVGQPKTHEKLIKLFKLNRKAGLKGLKHVTLNSTSPLLRGGHITAEHLISEIMSTFSASDTQKSEVELLYMQIKNRSSNLNRARPNSVASGLVYYWIRSSGIPITLKEFADSCNLSDITITKISKEVEKIISRRKKKAAATKRGGR
jgi:transcription initiation factor TFIIIB Brf1 subunit/transcription initiation factor TFIIB